MKGFIGSIPKSTRKEMHRTAIRMVISFGYGGFAGALLKTKEFQEENVRLRTYIKSGKAGKYGGSKKAKQDWDTEIPPMGYNKPDHLTEI